MCREHDKCKSMCNLYAVLTLVRQKVPNNFKYKDKPLTVFDEILVDKIYKFIISKYYGDTVCEDVTLWCDSSISDSENDYEMHEALVQTSPDINEESTIQVPIILHLQKFDILL